MFEDADRVAQTTERLAQLFREGRHHEIAPIARNLAVTPDVPADIYRFSGASAMRIGHLTQAAANLQAAVALAPDNGGAWLELGLTWYQLRQLPLAQYALSRSEALGAIDWRGRQASEIIGIVRGERILNRAEVLERVQAFDPIRQLPDVATYVADSRIRLPVVFGLGSERKSEVWLTIDDGPSPDITPVILDTLRNRDVRAAFFVVGKYAAEYPALVDRMFDEGHQVFGHGYTHTVFTDLDASEIARELEQTEAVLRQFRPTPTPYAFRLPGGMGWMVPAVHSAIRNWNSDAVLVHWTVDSLDCHAPHRFAHESDLEIDARIRVLLTILDPLFSAATILCHDNMVSQTRMPELFFREFYGGMIDQIRDLGLAFALRPLP